MHHLCCVTVILGKKTRFVAYKTENKNRRLNNPCQKSVFKRRKSAQNWSLFTQDNCAQTDKTRPGTVPYFDKYVDVEKRCVTFDFTLYTVEELQIRSDQWTEQTIHLAAERMGLLHDTSHNSGSAWGRVNLEQSAVNSPLFPHKDGQRIEEESVP